MKYNRKLSTPEEVKKKYPLTEEMNEVIENKMKELKDILSGRQNRLLLIIGPCSADNEESVMDYIFHLKKLQEKVIDKIFIIPRVYTSKPRTMGKGYKGLLHQPNPHEKPDLLEGIVATRKLHLRAIKEAGFICADELLYPEIFAYFDDILGYVVVGARSVENQQHRLTASGIRVPVGMKNPTFGDYSIMLNGVYAAQQAHVFMYRNWEVETEGNPYSHAILRGFSNRHGQQMANYHYKDLVRLCDLYDEYDLKNPAIIVDANHANSKKNPFFQPEIIMDVIKSIRKDPRIEKMVKGFMVESYLEDGAQSIDEDIYGMSVTDACLGWEKTEQFINKLMNIL